MIATEVRPRTSNVDREASILDAALIVLGRAGISGVTIRSVAKVAGVSVGLANYYFADKTSLICAALRRIGERDLDILRPGGDNPGERLRRALHRISDPDLTSPAYLALRLQLWSLASVDPRYGEINENAQHRYLDRLAELVREAMPGLDADEVARRSTDILVLQNGIWLTAAIINDRDALERSIAQCEVIAFSPARPISPTRRMSKGRRPR